MSDNITIITDVETAVNAAMDAEREAKRAGFEAYDAELARPARLSSHLGGGE